MPLDLLTELDILNRDELEPLRADLLRGEHARAALAIQKQKEGEAAVQRIERAHVEGLGELKLVVHPDIYFRMCFLFGPECWNDPEFQHHMAKCNPGMAVRSRARKTTVRVPGRHFNAKAQRPQSSAKRVQASAPSAASMPSMPSM